MVFWGFGGWAKIFGGNSLGRNDRRRSTSFSKKNCGYALKTLVCTRGKEITKKTKCLRREGYISPMCSAYPLNSLLPRGACGVLWST